MDAIDRDVAALKKCDAIYLLRGWESSKGANAEKALAEWMRLEVMYQEDADILEEALRVKQSQCGQNARLNNEACDSERKWVE